jgi:hypothetical protein
MAVIRLASYFLPLFAQPKPIPAQMNMGAMMAKIWSNMVIMPGGQKVASQRWY